MPNDIREKNRNFFGLKQSGNKKENKVQESRIRGAENHLETQKNKAQSGVHSGLFEKLEGFFNGSLEHRFSNSDALAAHFGKVEKGAYHYPTGDVLAAFGQLCGQKLGAKSESAQKLHEALQAQDSASSVSGALQAFSGVAQDSPRFKRVALLADVLANRWDHAANGGHGEWRVRPPADRMEGPDATAQSYHAIQHDRSPRKQLVAGIKNTFASMTQGTGALAKATTRPLKTVAKTAALQASLPVMRGAKSTQEATVKAAKATQKTTKAAAKTVAKTSSDAVKATQAQAKKSAAWVSESAVQAKNAGERGAKNVANAVVQATPVARTRLQEAEARVAQLEKQTSALQDQVLEARGSLLNTPVTRDAATWGVDARESVVRAGTRKDK